MDEKDKLTDFEKVYNLFFNPGEVTEIRGLGLNGKGPWEGFAKGTVSGYFDNSRDFADAAFALDQAGARGVYFTVNPVNPALLSRARNRLKVPKETTSDKDILCLRWLLLDFDPVRPSGISANEEEIGSARSIAEMVDKWIEEQELPIGIAGFSGNGAHTVSRLPDLLNDETSCGLIKKALQAVSANFSNEKVKIDEAVFNPARIWKLYGTTARKGDSTPDRPHRQSYLEDGTPASLKDVIALKLDQLGRLAQQAPRRDGVNVKIAVSSNGLDVGRYLRQYGKSFRVKEHSTGTMYVLDACVFDPSHTRNESAIIQKADGTLLYQCFHDSCKKWTWKEARNKISGSDSLAQFMSMPNGSYGSYGRRNSSDSEIIPLIEFPFKVFPDWFHDLIKAYSKGLQVEPELVAIIMLGALSGAIGNTVQVSVKSGYEVPPFLWIAYIAESGYGKSPAQDRILNPIRRLQAKDSDRYARELAEYDDIVRRAKKDDSIKIPGKPAPRHKVVSDTTIEALADVFELEPRGLICDKDEISGLVRSFNQYRRHGGDDRQKWLSLFNCKEWKIDRKSGSRFIKNTGLAIIGGIQTNVLSDIFGQAAFDDGLLPRFLLYHAQNKVRYFNRQGISEDTEKDWEDTINWCYQILLQGDEAGYVKPKVLSLNDDARDKWEVLYNWSQDVTPFLSERARIFIPKLVGYYSLKFAGILHILKCMSTGWSVTEDISYDVVEGAVALTEFFMGQAMHALELYDRRETYITEREQRLVKAVYSLRDEVKNGEVLLGRIVEVVNRELPQGMQLSSEKIARNLKDLGFVTKKGTANLSYMTWDEDKIQELLKQTVTTVTTVPALRPGSVLSERDWARKVSSDNMRFLNNDSKMKEAKKRLMERKAKREKAKAAEK